MTAPSSTVEATNDLPISLASSKHCTKAEIEDICSSVWDEIYQKDKFFRLYAPDYHGWRYTYHGDDLSFVTSELSIRLSHIKGEEEENDWQRRFCELAQYLQREGLFA